MPMLKLASLQRIKECDLTDPIIQKKTKERYAERLPENELVISPVEMFNCCLLLPDIQINCITLTLCVFYPLTDFMSLSFIKNFPTKPNQNVIPKPKNE